MPPKQRKEPPARPIALVDMGRMPQIALRVIAANIQTLLAAPVEMLSPMALPEEAFQPHRSQYDAGLILKYLAQYSFPNHSRILAITNVDLCIPILTYVFGGAELGMRLAVVSDFRLKYGEDGSHAPQDVYYERLVKVALHEIAHTLSLYHCDSPKCLMRYSSKLRHLDELELTFCERCRFMLRHSMKELHS